MLSVISLIREGKALSIVENLFDIISCLVKIRIGKCCLYQLNPRTLKTMTKISIPLAISSLLQNITETDEKGEKYVNPVVLLTIEKLIYDLWKEEIINSKVYEKLEEVKDNWVR